jgi:hypothetical protein
MKTKKENDRLKFSRLVEWMNENNMLNNDLGIIDYEVAEMFLETDAYKRFEAEMNDKNMHEVLNQLEFERGFIEGAEFVDTYYKNLSCGAIPYDSLSDSFKKTIENIK